MPFTHGMTISFLDGKEINMPSIKTSCCSNKNNYIYFPTIPNANFILKKKGYFGNVPKNTVGIPENGKQFKFLAIEAW